MKKLGSDRLLLFALAVPVVLALIVGGGSAVINGILMIARVAIPSIWTLFAYAYVAIIAYLIGKRSNRK